MVTSTSIQSYRELKAEKEPTQLLLVAAFLEKETKAGRAHSIRTIADHFTRAQNAALSQISSVSARLKKIKEEGVIYNGRVMQLHLVETRKNATGRQAEYYMLVNAQKPQAATQGTLFNL